MINDLPSTVKKMKSNEADEVAGERNLWQRLQKMNEWIADLNIMREMPALSCIFKSKRCSKEILVD